MASLTDKLWLEKWEALTDVGWEMVSTGGTAKALRKAKIEVITVRKVTGFPEMLDGRLKTLHPRVFGGILPDRDNPKHMRIIKRYGIRPIDIVVVNLYDFLKDPGIWNIDVGGPSMLRAGAKNGKHVIVVIDPKDYDWIIKEVLETGTVSEKSREKLALKVFQKTCAYDRAIVRWIKQQIAAGKPVFALKDAKH
ncbi:MAG: IMP cyclohydrolase [bacterium]|nr:IMP cyclohydrolase [bacterium]